MAPPPVIRLHPDDGVVIARTTLLPGAPVADGVTAAERIPAGPQGRRPPDRRRASRCAAMARSSVSPPSPIAPGQHVHVHNCEMGDFAKDYAYGVDAKPTAPANSPASFMGIRRPGRARRDAQLHRHPDQRELQRACRRAGRRHVPPQPVHRRRSAGRLSQRRWRRRADPQDRLRHERGRGAAPAAPHPGRLRAAREFLPCHRARAGLRGEPDRRPGAGAKAGRPAEVDGHPDDGRHAARPSRPAWSS